MRRLKCDVLEELPPKVQAIDTQVFTKFKPMKETCWWDINMASSIVCDPTMSSASRS